VDGRILRWTTGSVNAQRPRELATLKSRAGHQPTRAYWSCVGRATVHAAIASANWEWNPLMSETAIRHAGKAYACVNGKCTGEGGWTDFVMTPLRGMGFRIAGDIARAKLWPVLDRNLSGNIAARILKVAVKIATDPSGMANAAFNLNFENVLASRPHGSRR
jgi:hypothetical protein